MFPQIVICGCAVLSAGQTPAPVPAAKPVIVRSAPVRHALVLPELPMKSRALDAMALAPPIARPMRVVRVESAAREGLRERSRAMEIVFQAMVLAQVESELVHYRPVVRQSGRN